jgi:hypothetical protein
MTDVPALQHSRLCTCRLGHEARVHSSTVCTPLTVCPSLSNAGMLIRFMPRNKFPQVETIIA